MSKLSNQSATTVPMDDETDNLLRGTVRVHTLLALFVAVAIVGGLLSWAAFAKISGAVVSPATVVVDGNTKQVQHREGGIVRKIAVRDGDRVKAGDLLLRLDDTVTRANLAVITKHLSELTAQQLRLEAERDDRSAIKWPAVRQQTLGEIERSQEMLLDARRNSKEGRKRQLEEQIRQFHDQIEGLDAQVSAKVVELKLIAEELIDLDALLQKNLVPKSRVTGMRREQARLQGEHGRLISEIARAKEAISERRVKILQIEESYRAEVLENLQQVRSHLAQLEEQKIAAEDELTRVSVKSPISGIVHELSVHTIGGVIAPGETVMRIVPEGDQLIVEAKVRPVDIEQMATGQLARVRFPSFDQRTTPELGAELMTISADLAEDEQTGDQFYIARMAIMDTELSKLGSRSLIPGMPVETFLQTEKRTVLSYLVKPITDQIAHAMRER